MNNPRGHAVLLGSIGGDGHSVGLTILRRALTTHGYSVHYIGTHNELEDFFKSAWAFNAVMISSMDGHARYYLRGFPELMQKYRPARARWYIGGNLTLGTGVGEERFFVEMGFARAFVKFTDITTVLDLLERDLAHEKPIAEHQAFLDELRLVNATPCEIREERMASDEFYGKRRRVLEQWPTGQQAAQLEENAEFLSAQPSFSRAQGAVRLGRRLPLIQPRSGVALWDEQMAHFESLKAGGADVLSYQVDSLTRYNNYRGAEEAIKSSRPGHSQINGFPAVNHGVETLRKIASRIKTPLQIRHSTRDPCLLAEISYAGGVTAFEGGPICYNVPYYKDYRLEDSIRRWQYVDRLTGLYFERFGLVLDREFFGVLTGTLITPSLAIVTGILEAVLAAQQGVKSVSLGYAEQGHRIQDVAAIRTMAEMAEETLANMGFGDVQVNTVFHQYMAAFPSNPERAEQLIFQSAVTGGLSGATRILVKTPVEALRVPSLGDNLKAFELVRLGIRSTVQPIDETLVVGESALIRREVRSMLDSVVFCGDGNVGKGVVKGFARGYLEVPFAPSIHSRGNVMTARDVEGAVRFLSVGDLPFDREVKEYHEDKMQERRRAERIPSERKNYLLVEQDVLRVPREQYERWPLFGEESLVFSTFNQERNG